MVKVRGDSRQSLGACTGEATAGALSYRCATKISTSREEHGTARLVQYGLRVIIESQ